MLLSKMSKFLGLKKKRIIYTVEYLEQFTSIDNQLLPVIERAKQGSVTANYDLYRAFYKGEGVEQNLDFASQFLISVILDASDGFEKENDVETLILALKEYIHLGLEIGDKEYVKQACYDIIILMYRELPIEEWDFSLFQLIESAIRQIE